VLAVHLGRSANCSSIGSIVDFLFVSSVTGAALLSAVAVLLPRAASPERVTAESEGGESSEAAEASEGRAPEASPEGQRGAGAEDVAEKAPERGE